MKNFFSLLVLCCLLVINQSGYACDNDILESVKTKFVKQVTVGMDTYEVSEIYDRNDNKKELLKKALSNKYKPGGETLRHKEIFVKRVDDTSKFHLGVIQLQFTNPKAALEAYKSMFGQQVVGFFDNVKILTQYKALNRGDSVLVIYSETFIDPKVKQFINEYKIE